MNCPSCGRPIAFEEKYSKIVCCWYCNTILEFWKWELTKLWEQSEFIEFPSLFEVGKQVSWEWQEVYVKGQLRYEYDWGFFDVFFVIINGKEYYIQEDDGSYTLLADTHWQASDAHIVDAPIWEHIDILWKNIFVQETWLLKLVAIKWFINNTLIPGKEYEYLDGVVDGHMIYFYKEKWVNSIRFSSQVTL